MRESESNAWESGEASEGWGGVHLGLSPSATVLEEEVGRVSAMVGVRPAHGRRGHEVEQVAGVIHPNLEAALGMIMC